MFIWQYIPDRQQTRVHLNQWLHFIPDTKKAKPEEQITSFCKVGNGNESTSTPTSTASSSYIPIEGENWQLSKGDMQKNTADKFFNKNWS